MCGIVAVVQRPGTRETPTRDEVLQLVTAGREALGSAELDVAGLNSAADFFGAAEKLLRGTVGVRVLVRDPELASAVARFGEEADSAIATIEGRLDAGTVTAARLEELNACIVALKDAVWSLRRDRLLTAEGVASLLGKCTSGAAIDAFTSVQIALSAIDRLEVRGRDSAGLLLMVRDHGLDLDSGDVADLISGRTDPLLRAMAVRTPEGFLAFSYKAAAEIGELGDNTNQLRSQIASDELLHLSLQSETARMTLVGHTRWASVGMISEANAHPIDSTEVGRSGPFVAAALNGDVDNYAELKVSQDLNVPTEITTDAKVIPVMVSHRLQQGLDPADAFRATVASFDGSVAIAALSAAAPDSVMIALRGSGQGLYVGEADDMYIVASEPYGLVEQCDRYLRLDGENAAADSSRGQVVVCGEASAGDATAVRRYSYAGAELSVSANELVTPQITTRDIDRGDFPHFLLKEMSQAPSSFRKTLRGKLLGSGDDIRVELGTDTIPDNLRAAISSGKVTRVTVIGQGTAAVAGRGLAAAVRAAIGQSALTVEALPATELSGFGLRDDMSDTLVVAISQSGTTTDTNRTVDLAREHGAWVIAIVNRRNSDLTERADGVLYTSDGRDVEMAVPSTKAFYAQIAAGFLLAGALADLMGSASSARSRELLNALVQLPSAMEATLKLRGNIGEIARKHAPSRRYWAIVGNGSNQVAAEEIRIKLSELCYKSIACDVTEDKKHIDLSAEPLVIVCASGLSGSTAGDVAKEVAIYRAHKALPIVIANDATTYTAAVETIVVPHVHPDLDFVLSAMAGHLFGYEAALAIDGQARVLRRARAGVEAAIADGELASIDELASNISGPASEFFAGLASKAYDGHLEASTAVRLASAFRYATGATPLDGYQVEFGKLGTPSEVVNDLVGALTKAIDELTRPVDAIKHQAKTVTVGISRSDETFLQAGLVRSAMEAGVPRDRLTYKALKTLAALDAAVTEVLGFTHYRIDGSLSDESATIHVTGTGGIASGMKSRTDADPRLRGTKHRAAFEREVTVALGRADGRTVILIPEIRATAVTGMALLHVSFHDRLPPAVTRAVLEGYRDRYSALRDAVTETEPTFADAVLGTISIAELLTAPVYVLADRWKS